MISLKPKTIHSLTSCRNFRKNHAFIFGIEICNGAYSMLLSMQATGGVCIFKSHPKPKTQRMRTSGFRSEPETEPSRTEQSRERERKRHREKRTCRGFYCCSTVTPPRTLKNKILIGSRFYFKTANIKTMSHLGPETRDTTQRTRHRPPPSRMMRTKSEMKPLHRNKK